ncbi:kinesin-like protein KIF14 [Ischnura elegans]|uniref:kinesin-like protein KIF14 n=1 Tax=Ischnura elegans TaxID=197161 RepID=UPI001ED87FD2|nr:kinesin-like protein KIF14 [Ischnura elegans]
MASQDKSEFNCNEVMNSADQFAVPQRLKSGNSARSTPKKTTLARSRSIPGLSSSTTPKASPTSSRGGTPKSGKIASKSLSAVKLPEPVTPVNSHNGETHTYQTPESCFFKVGAASLSATPECFGFVHMETPHKSSATVVPLEEHEGLSWGATETSSEDETSNLTVGVRVRPLSSREASDSAVKVVLSVKDNEVFVSPVSDSGLAHQFSYDHCFWSVCGNAKVLQENAGKGGGGSQEDVYNVMVRPLLEKSFEGYNACLFAYGQTGSGKSYSMMGVGLDHVVSEPEAEAGIIPRFCHQLFQRVSQMETHTENSPGVMTSGTSSVFKQITVEVSYFEIYNEKIHDLLGESDGGTRTRRVPLRVREHPVFGPHVVDLSTHGVVSYKDMQEWILVGNSRRATAATEMNDKSSRSHSIFSIILTQSEKESLAGGSDTVEVSRRSKINLVDLAGSERLSSHASTSGDRMREGVSINRSLLTLGKVIAALSEGSGSAKKKTFIPYRDSVLTWLLRESLGGNSRTAMLATVSPANIHVEETLSTLRYATQAATIVNRVRVNEGHNDRLIRELRAEIERLRALRMDCEHQRRIQPRRIIPPSTRNACVGSEEFGVDAPVPASLEVSLSEVEALRQRLKNTEDQLAKAEKTWAERIAEAEKCKSAEIAFLRRRGLAVCLSSKEESSTLSSDTTVQKTACLINLSPDPGLSGTLLYILPPGNVRIGRLPNTPESSDESLMADILLDGPLVGVDHCVIENNGGKLTLHPGAIDSCDTYLNGHSVSSDKSISLQHGDRLVIGGNHFFLVNNPSELKSAAIEKSRNRFVDFEFARQELKQVQEERLTRELEEAKLNAVKELQRANEEAEDKLHQQRLAFEKQISNLGHTLVQQKEMLERVEKAKGELEHQKTALEAELQRGLERKKALADKAATTPDISPYTSNFLQNLQDVLNCTEVADDEMINSSFRVTEEESRKEEGVSLHEMQLMVKEASGLCRDHNLAYEFQYVQVLNSDGLLEPKVKVCDLDEKVFTFWHTDHFIQVLNSLRDHEEGDSMQDLFDSSQSWEAEEEESNQEGRECGDDSSTASAKRGSIKIETGCVTKALNDSISQLSSSMLQEEEEEEESSSDKNHCRLLERMSIGRGPEISSDSSSSQQSQKDVEDEVHAALFAIEEATEDLLAIFSRSCMPLASDPIPTILEFEVMMRRVKSEVSSALKWNQEESSCEKDNESWREDVETVISPGKFRKPCNMLTPVKSSLRSPMCPESLGGSKKVRFFFPEPNE